MSKLSKPVNQWTARLELRRVLKGLTSRWLHHSTACPYAEALFWNLSHILSTHMNMSYYYSYFVDEDIKVHRKCMTYSRSYVWYEMFLVFKLSPAAESTLNHSLSSLTRSNASNFEWHNYQKEEVHMSTLLLLLLLLVGGLRQAFFM